MYLRDSSSNIYLIFDELYLETLEKTHLHDHSLGEDLLESVQVPGMNVVDQLLSVHVLQGHRVAISFHTHICFIFAFVCVLFQIRLKLIKQLACSVFLPPPHSPTSEIQFSPQ